MKKIYILCLLALCSGRMDAQSLTACDSLVISCCGFGTVGPDTIVLQVSNPSSVLFDYPGFALLDSNMDTIAKETVHYFGISTGPQEHHLVKMAPLLLPFTGYLHLYTHFYDSLACVFPYTITSTALIETAQNTNGLKVSPNPAVDEVLLEWGAQSGADNMQISITAITGEVVYSRVVSTASPLRIPVSCLAPGIYSVHALHPESGNSVFRKLVLTGQ